MPSFGQIYGQWLDNSVRISQRTYDYVHGRNHWAIQTINTVYGRAGLIVDMGDEVVYLVDNRLACPAEGFMFNLLKELAERIIKGLKSIRTP